MATQITIGPDPDTFLAAAEQDIDQHFISQQSSLNYQSKVMLAYQQLATEDAQPIIDEAKMRGVNPMDLATQIIDMDANASKRELDRIRIKLELRALKGNPIAVTLANALLDKYGIGRQRTMVIGNVNGGL
jgi:hypothetical protein